MQGREVEMLQGFKSQPYYAVVVLISLVFVECEGLSHLFATVCVFSEELG